MAWPLPAPGHCSEAMTPAPAPCLAQSSLASLSLAPLAVPCLLQRYSLPMSLPSTHTPLSSSCLHLSPPPLPRGHLPLTSRLHCPWGHQPLSRLGEQQMARNCGRLYRAGPRDLTRGTRVLHPRTCSSSPTSSLLESRGRGKASIFVKGPGPWHRTQAQRSGARPGRVRGQLCQSTSRAHTFPTMPSVMVGEGSGGRNTAP